MQNTIKTLYIFVNIYNYIKYTFYICVCTLCVCMYIKREGGELYTRIKSVSVVVQIMNKSKTSSVHGKNWSLNVKATHSLSECYR